MSAMTDDDRIVPLRRRRKADKGCPICNRPTVEKFRPFCSARCADADLGRWLTGGYRIPTEEVPPEGTLPAEEEP